MSGRILTERLLATTSLAALIFAAGTPSASATVPCATTVQAGASYSNSGAVSCVTAPNASVGITNNAGGTIGPSTNKAAVSVSGTLSGGITNAGTITSTVADGAVVVTGLVQGGITNSGKITAATTGSATNYGAIVVGPFSNVSSFGGNISNSGTLSVSAANTSGSVFAAGVLSGASIFTGSIINNGTIAGSATLAGTSGNLNVLGVTVGGSLFTGNVSNVGTISVSGVSTDSRGNVNVTGIATNYQTFVGGITNSGMLSVTASGAGNCDHSVFASGILVNGTRFGPTSVGAVGGIVNSGSIIVSATNSRPNANDCNSVMAVKATGISVNPVSIFNGGITNNGSINTAAIFSGPECGNALAVGVQIHTSTFNGGFANNGTIAASAILTGSTAASARAYGVSIAGTVFTGGISNAGLISATATATGTGRNDGLSATAVWVQVSTFTGGISNSGTILATTSGAGQEGVPIGIKVSAQSFGGGIGNSGMISVSASSTVAGGQLSSTGIKVFANAFSGGISNSGTIIASAMNTVGDANAYARGIEVTATTFAGGLSNGGTISANALVNGTGIEMNATGIRFNASVFSGTIVNSGQIIATASGNTNEVFATGLSVQASTFSGGLTTAVSNSGSIIARAGSNGSGAQAFGVSLAGNSIFAGSIVNSGTIAGLITRGTGLGVGIEVSQTGAVTITNSGLVEGTTWGISETNTSTNPGTLTINLTGGTIMGSTTTTGGAIGLSARADVLNISGGTIVGNVVGGGTANTVNVNMGTGSFNYAYEIAGIGTLNLKSGALLLQNLTGPGVSTQTYNQSPGTTLALEVSPAATNNHASVTASGTVSLGAGSVLQAYEGAFGWTPGTYTYAGVVQANTITGSFVAASNSPFFTASVTQNAVVPASDTLTLTMLSPSQVPGLNANQVSVANAILGISGGNSTLDQIFLLPGSPSSSGPSAGLPTLGNALTQLSGSQYSSTNYQPLIASWQTFTDSLTGRLAQGNGYGGTVNASLNSSQGIQFAMADIPQLAQANVVTDANTRTLRGAPPRVASQWGVWGRGYGVTSNAPSTATSAAYSESGAGLIIGADNQITDRIVAGVALNVSTDKATVTGGGFTQSNAYEGSVYGQYTVDPNWYVNGMAGFGWHTYSTARVVTLLSTNVNNGSFDGQSYRLYGESGYALHPAFLPQTQITPYAGLGYLHTHTDSFSETGSATALNVQAMDPNSLTMSLGARAATTLQIGSTVFRPEIRAAWQHELLDSAATMRASFVVAPSSTFTSTGASFGDDSFLGGAGITTTITASTQIFLDYDARVTGGYTAQAVSGGFRVQF